MTGLPFFGNVRNWLEFYTVKPALDYWNILCGFLTITPIGNIMATCGVIGKSDVSVFCMDCRWVGIVER